LANVRPPKPLRGSATISYPIGTWYHIAHSFWDTERRLNRGLLCRCMPWMLQGARIGFCSLSYDDLDYPLPLCLMRI